jgi:hypothetical protein
MHATRDPRDVIFQQRGRRARDARRYASEVNSMKKNISYLIVHTFLIIALGQVQVFPLSWKPSAKLEATTSIRRQSVCLAGSGEVIVNLALTVKFTNVGDYPAIIAKNSGEIIASQHIAHTEGLVDAGKYEYGLRGDMYEFPFVRQGDSPGESFVILKPAETLEREIDAWAIRLKYPGRYEHFAQAAHFLSIGFFTMDSHLTAADGRVDWSGKQQRSRWRKYGDLWSGITSRPMPMEFPLAEKLAACSSRAA